MEKKLKILVLGADGFLGSNLTISLLKEKKYFIRAFDLFQDGKSRNLENYRDNLEIFQGNFLNREDLKSALVGIDYVFHFVSFTTPGSSMRDPIIDIETNLKGTVELLEECTQAGIKKIIFPSSGGAIYGDQNKELYSEDDPLLPISPYAISKLSLERYFEYFRITHGLDYLILRLSNPYGPLQNIIGNQGIIPIFLNLIKNNQPVTVFGDGDNVRDYIFIDDAIANIKKLAFMKKTKYRIYNIGSGLGTSINDLLDIMREVTDKKISIKIAPERKSDLKSIVLDINRAKSEIDYSFRNSLKRGIGKTWGWIEKL